MSNNETQKALEDISYIKDMIKDTSLSLKSLSNSFIQMGIYMFAIIILFTFDSFTAFQSSSSDAGSVGYNIYNNVINRTYTFTDLNTYRLVNFSLIIVFTVLLSLSGRALTNILKKNKLKGLSRQLINMWMCIIIFNMAIIKLFPSLTDGFIRAVSTVNQENSAYYRIYNFYLITLISLLTLSIALWSFYIFTKLQFIKIMAIVYTACFSLLVISPFNTGFVYIFITPATLVILGIYLKLIEIR